MTLSESTFSFSLAGGVSLEHPVLRLGHTYGDLHQLSIFCSVSDKYRATKPLEWQHGWVPSFPGWDSESIVGTDGLSRYRKKTHLQLVATKDQERQLQESGYSHVRAIGLPFCYVPNQKILRPKNSAIFVFRHGIFEKDTRLEMLASISRAAHEASQLNVAPFMLIHGSDVNEKVVINAKELGVTLILGGHPQDINSLKRVRQVFEYFETVVTDYIGSHVLYATICGAHVSFIDAVETWIVPNSTFYRNNPLTFSTAELRNRLVSSASEMRKTIHSLGVVDKETALAEAGFHNTPSPEEIIELVGWEKNSLKSVIDFARVFKGNLWLASRALDYLKS
jgi:hypothetical protein